MKSILLLISCMFVHLLVKANDPKKERLKELIKSGNKVYISAEKNVYKKHAKSILVEGCWTIVNDLKEADFILKIEAKRIVTVGFFADAIFIDPTTKEELYKTKKSNTAGRMTLHGKKAVFKKLIRRRVIPLCNPDNIEKVDSADDF